RDALRRRLPVQGSIDRDRDEDLSPETRRGLGPGKRSGGLGPETMPMVMEAEIKGVPAAARRPARPAPSWMRRQRVKTQQFLGHYIFSSLTRRILFLNLAALCILVVGILYLNQFRDGLIEARVESLM